MLDYIFIMDSSSCHVAISGLLAPPQSHAELEPGLPQKDVCGSDHISLCADLELGELHVRLQPCVLHQLIGSLQYLDNTTRAPISHCICAQVE